MIFIEHTYPGEQLLTMITEKGKLGENRERKADESKTRRVMTVRLPVEVVQKTPCFLLDEKQVFYF